MSVQIHGPDFAKSQLLNAVLQVIAGNHGSPIEGSVWYDSTAKRVKYTDDTANRTLVSQTVLDAAVALLQPLTEKGAANGYASLDSGGKIPAAQLPSSAMEFKGGWNATTNTPALADGTGNAGDQYRVTTAGARDLGSGSIDFAVGDSVMYSGTVWEKSDNTESVASVAGKTGVVTLVKGDVGLGNVDNTADTAKPVSTAQQTALNLKADLASPALTGNPTAPTPAAADNDTSIATTAFVQGELTAKAPLASPTFTGDPKAPTAAPGDNDTSIATTAFVTAALAAASGRFTADITGDGVATQFTVTHNLGSKYNHCSVADVAADEEAQMTKKRPTNDTVRLDFVYAPPNGKVYRVTVSL